MPDISATKVSSAQIRTLSPARVFTLEEALEFIDDDELVEIVPDDIRLRKKILSELDRRRHARKERYE